ncbi:hypothetical protein CK203_035688 [Vitis vinifera]|uniref:Uncharacterized protein n=1 Tax=Vitis vinifera TaxID=29760 RepID=A0A438ICX8_VITVI|nr:hypothetical protein CK203_035688 [Vitis vinifera]
MISRDNIGSKWFLCIAYVLLKDDQLANALTKPLHHSYFLSLKTKIGIFDGTPS